ncbi:MAG: DNA gyrase inhibitor YacG [Planctomycetota bacterium]
MRLHVPTFDCPTCGEQKTVENKEELAYRPFCSYRCKMIDLGRWLDGTYCVSEPTGSESDLAGPIIPDEESDDG